MQEIEAIIYVILNSFEDFAHETYWIASNSQRSVASLRCFREDTGSAQKYSQRVANDIFEIII
jgi:hypothetical protein